MTVREFATSTTDPRDDPCSSPHLDHCVRLLATPTHLCDARPDYLVLVTSRVDSLETRHVVRQTWGSVQWSGTWASGQRLNMTFRLAFSIGTTPDSGVQHKVAQEQVLHNDLVQGDYLDSYYNLSLKTMTGLGFASHYCPGARLLLKCDEDVFPQLPQMDGILARLPPRSVIGALCGGCGVIRSGKWGIPRQLFPAEHYPPFMLGPLYGLSMELVAPLYNLSLHSPLFPLEDVFFTGLLIKKLDQQQGNKTRFIHTGSNVNYRPKHWRAGAPGVLRPGASRAVALGVYLPGASRAEAPVVYQPGARGARSPRVCSKWKQFLSYHQISASELNRTWHTLHETCHPHL